MGTCVGFVGISMGTCVGFVGVRYCVDFVGGLSV